MRSAMMRLDPTTGTFTSFHLSFIQLCMETRSYAAAEPILDNYIHSLPTKIPAAVREGLEYSVPCADIATSGEYIHQGSGHSDKVTLTDLQEYYLLGAMAYLGVRQFSKARHFLEYVLVAPSANVANGLMLEAYKKLVLVNCLVNSTVWNMFHSTKACLTPVRRAARHGRQTQTQSSKSSQHPRHTRLWQKRTHSLTISRNSKLRSKLEPVPGQR
jgi:COP9 signalosome complex subunit 3